MELKLDEFSKACTCGRSHALSVKRVLIEKGAINKLTEFITVSNNGSYPVVICDTHTYEAAGKAVFELIENEKKDIIVLQADGLHADENGVQKIIEHLNIKATLLLAVGAGTLHDLTRYVAKEKNIPFIAVPTAASVDGFVSTVAAMTIGGFKVTYPAVSPIAVFADTDIFMKAPYRLTASGISDLLGKYTAILDWQVGNLLTGEYICESVIAIELSAVKKVVEGIDALQENAYEAYENLMYALILSGLAMQMVGNSRPASGAEHHLSHLWEMHIINDQTEALHGEKVGVALAIVCDTYKKLLEIEDIEGKIMAYQGLPHSFLKDQFKALYLLILEENMPDILDEIDTERFVAQFETIKNLVRKLPSGETIRELLTRAGAKVTPRQIGLDDSIIEKSIKLSPYVRRRLTLMRTLGLLSSSQFF